MTRTIYDASLYIRREGVQMPDSYDISMCRFETKMCEMAQNKRAELEQSRTTHKIIRTALHYHNMLNLSIAEVV